MPKQGDIEPNQARYRRAWLMEKMGAFHEAFRVAAGARAEGAVDRAALREAVGATLASHSMARARYSPEDSTMVFDAPRAEVALIEGADFADAAGRWLAALPPFRLAEGRLVRAAVVAGHDASGIVLAAHRALAEAGTLERLIGEAVSRLGARSGPTGTASSGVTVDASVESTFERAVAFARAEMAKAEEPVELTGDRARPIVQSLRARSHVEALEPALIRAVRELAGDLGVEEEAVYRAAFALLASRYGRKRDVLSGHRVLDGDNVVVGATHVAPDLTGAELVRRTNAMLAAARPFAHVPWERVLEALAPRRDTSRAPVFQLEVGVRVRPPLSAPFRHFDLPPQGGAADLAVEVVLGAEPHFVVTEAVDLFDDPGRAPRLCWHLRTLLLGLAADPGRKAVQLPMVTPEEREALVSRFNPTKRFDSDDTIASRIERAARRSPDAVAITGDGPPITYGELEARANRLARKLRSLGVGRDERVGISMDRTPRLIVALYAILKAGGAYVPIEPTQPRDRLQYVLGDAAPKVILIEGDQLAGLDVPAATILRLDAIGPELESLSPDPLEPAACPAGASPADALAYIIYTSGSTGRPKGCLVDNRHVVRLLDATHAWFGFDDRDVWTMFHSVAFDFSVWEIWGALSFGGKLVVVPYLVARSPQDFRAMLAEEGVTVLNQTPSAFRQLIEADAKAEAGSELSLRLVIFGGEALEMESLRPWFDRHGDAKPQLVNMYGITETTVHVTYRPLSRADLGTGHASVIGVPIPDLSTYVVDEALELVPIGVPGELLVAGAGVSRGYWNRPELTAERFIPDTFAGGATKVYRSGDLAKRLPSGELDYLGRIDQQIKIRGFRIETGEVEAALRRTGLVSDVAVLAAKRTEHDTVLVAYVVAAAEVRDLRAAARAALPEYMVPSVFVRVPAIPMTGNGKVDRRALPDPWSVGEGEASADVIPPKAGVEASVAAAFSEVLRRSDVGATFHFFNEGGTSLEAVLVSEKLSASLNVDVPVLALFEHTTVESLAAFIESAKRPVAPSAPIVTAMDLEPIAIIGAAGRFPGANDVPTFWQNLLDGKETITFFRPEELDPSLDPATTSLSTYVRARGVLADPAGFDAAFFGMSPREAETVDPQQRLALELAWEALETAGYDPARVTGAIGVYAGEYNVTYYIEHVLKRPDVVERAGAFQVMVGNEKDFIATRIAHKLDLRGPALSLHTACSTSLVAVAQAFFALRTRQCDMAIAGAAAITCPPSSGYVYGEGGMLSPDGHTRTFDADAQGTVFSDGGAFVVLKRLSDAQRDGDAIWAVIRGAATNNDGANKMSFTAPSPVGQAEVVARALEVAGVSADSMGYIEAHGTATPLGDPIEVEGLRRVFARYTSRKAFCGIGSVKSNFGHVVAAAGATGLIKAALAIRTGTVPATLHYRTPNPKLALEGSPFYVVSENVAWPEEQRPRRAGVSSFGVGGTNAHIVLEEAPPSPERRPSSRAQRLLVVSARSEAAVANASRRLAAALSETDADLRDVAFTLAEGRRPFAHRSLPAGRGPARRAAPLGRGAGAERRRIRVHGAGLPICRNGARPRVGRAGRAPVARCFAGDPPWSGLRSPPGARPGELGRGAPECRGAPRADLVHPARNLRARARPGRPLGVARSSRGAPRRAQRRGNRRCVRRGRLHPGGRPEGGARPRAPDAGAPGGRDAQRARRPERRRDRAA